MTREIKFRAWNPIEKKLEYWTLNDLCYHSPDRPDICLQKWEQFTGLKDKNGKEIYEGDIVCIPDEYTDVIVNGQGPTEPLNHLSKVKYENYSFGVDIMERGDFLTEGFITFSRLQTEINIMNIEVIGNVYENPDLIK